MAPLKLITLWPWWTAANAKTAPKPLVWPNAPREQYVRQLLMLRQKKQLKDYLRQDLYAFIKLISVRVLPFFVMKKIFANMQENPWGGELCIYEGYKTNEGVVLQWENSKQVAWG